MMFRDARKGQFEWRNTIAPLLGDWVVLLAMKQGRAPLAVSSTLWKVLLGQGFLNDLDELGNIARRFSFLGDERLLLAELRIRTATTRPFERHCRKRAKSQRKTVRRSVRQDIDWRIDGPGRSGHVRAEAAPIDVEHRLQDRLSVLTGSMALVQSSPQMLLRVPILSIGCPAQRNLTKPRMEGHFRYANTVWTT
jgi:hypothetical protein